MWWEQLGQNLISFVLGGGLVLLLVNWFINRKLNAYDANKKQKIDDAIKESRLVNIYRMALAALLKWIVEFIRHPNGGSEEYIRSQVLDSWSRFDCTDRELKNFNEDLLARYKGKEK